MDEFLKNLMFLSPLLVGFLAPIITESYKKYLESKKPLKGLYYPTIEDKTDPILDIIMDHLKPSYLAYWEAENGDTTISGHHIIKLSIQNELPGRLKDGTFAKRVKNECQKIPIFTFGRNIQEMKSNRERDLLSHECDKNDDLALYHKAYNIATGYFMKVYTKESWTGLLVVAFDTKTELSDIDVEWLKVQVSKLDNIHT